MKKRDIKKNTAVRDYKARARARLKNLKQSYRRTTDPALKKKRAAQITMLKRELKIK